MITFIIPNRVIARIFVVSYDSYRDLSVMLCSKTIIRGRYFKLVLGICVNERGHDTILARSGGNPELDESPSRSISRQLQIANEGT
jgi:hypothetical protein